MNTWKTKSGYVITKLLSGRSNVFFLSNGNKSIIIDTSIKMLWRVLDKKIRSKKIRKIDYLILTHAHFDHVANANRLKRDYSSLVFIQNMEAEYLKKGKNVEVKGTILFSKIISTFLGGKIIKYMKYEPCEYDYIVENKFDISDYGFNAYIIHTPGHTKGSMSLIVDDEVAIVGDTMFGVFKSSVFPPFAENREEIIKSWGKLLETNCLIFLPSHGKEKTREQVEIDYNKRKIK